jgi:chondroitin 4-sulfotransferase 11
VLETARTVYRSLPSGFQRRVLVARRTPLWLDAGIVFIHIPKAAGTAINEALYGRFMGHVRASDIERSGSPALRALPRFAIVRNPWDRLVSAYRFVKRGGGIGGPNAGRVRRARQYRAPQFETFERFVHEWLAGRDLAKLDPVFHPQSLYVCGRDGDLLVNHLGHYEDLDTTLRFLHESLPALGPFPQSNRSGGPVDYRTFYTPQLADLAGFIYADDVRIFGYSFD